MLYVNLSGLEVELGFVDQVTQNGRIRLRCCRCFCDHQLACGIVNYQQHFGAPVRAQTSLDFKMLEVSVRHMEPI